MKQNDKQKIEKRNKVLKIVKRVLDIIIYSWSVIMTICLVVGSCSNKKARSNNVSLNNEPQQRLNISRDNEPSSVYNVNNSNWYVFKEINETSMPLYYSKQFEIGSHYDVNVNVDYGQGATGTLTFNEIIQNGDLYAYKNDELHSVSEFVISFHLYSVGNNLFRYRIQNVGLVLDDSTAGYFLTKKDDSSANTYIYDIHPYINGIQLMFYSTNDDVYSYLLDYFFKISSGAVDFIFNDQINYMAPAGQTLANSYNQGGGSDHSYYYDIGYFVSGGEIFNQIRVDFLNADAVTFLIDDEKSSAPQGSNYYFSMFYYNSDYSHLKLVNVRDYAPYKTSNGGYGNYQLNSSHWISQEYRSLKLITYNQTSINNLTMFNNNSAVGSTISSGDVNLGSVFDLLAISLSSLMPLFNISIIPGITIGILLFLPLVVTIIVLVFKAVKK